MSIKYMGLGWMLDLPPNQKLVYMSLADQANDLGVCWPSIKNIAIRVRLEQRSVQRILRTLENKRLIRIERRFRNDGSPTSNKFFLLGNIPGDNLSPGPGKTKNKGVTLQPLHDDLDDTQTVTKSSNEPLQHENITFPGKLDCIYHKQILNKFSNVPLELLQQGLDELATRLDKTQINNPVLWLQKTLENLVVTDAGLKKKNVRVKLMNQTKNRQGL